MTQILLDYWILPIIQAIAVTLVPVFLGVIGSWLKQKHINNTIIEALTRAAALGYVQILQSGQPVTSKGILSAAIQAGVAYMKDRVPQYLAKKNLSTDDIVQMVHAEIAKKIADHHPVTVEPVVPEKVVGE
jgi:hypothetical protein